jgi:hypothetical protein
MRDDASPLEGWDYHEYIKFAPKATNDVMGSLFFFLRDTLLRFCHRIEDLNIHFRLLNVDARELPDHLSTEESQFDRIEVGYKFSLDLTSKHMMTVDTNIGLKHLRSRIRRTRKNPFYIQPAPQIKDHQPKSNTANALPKRCQRGILQ